MFSNRRKRFTQSRKEKSLQMTRIHTDYRAEQGSRKRCGREEPPVCRIGRRIDAKTRMGRRGSRKDAKTQRTNKEVKRKHGTHRRLWRHGCTLKEREREEDYHR